MPVAAFDACLPQTQCGRCGYAGCLPYAEALARGEAPPTLCPPGGEATRRALAGLLGADVPTPPLSDEPPVVARVREIDCIGCRRCIEVCPVDAILGAAGRMHTVFTAWCNGCALCLPVCPTDCLELAPAAAPPAAAQNRARHAR
ncbi:MAG: RnfABCDGE type electron transport complex subunit B, partial [Gammaproteobacteria bacterium]|nr:RnfABCDGE type electron transport complex subunit B [Gammaproteobacteria bacterium]